MELFQELRDKSRQLDELYAASEKLLEDYANAEVDYKRAVARTTLKLKDEGYGVGMIKELCGGEEEVVKANYNRIMTEGRLKINQEGINILKIAVKQLGAQIDREWSK